MWIDRAFSVIINTTENFIRSSGSEIIAAFSVKMGE
jgi:hypothetical protein